MSLNKAVLALALGGTLMMFNVSANAKDHGGMHNKHSVEHHQMMMEELGVNDEQRAQMNRLHQERMKAVKAHKEQMKELMEQQRHLMQQEALDKTKLRDNLRKQADIKAEMMVDKHQHHQQVNKVLSEEQRTKMKEMKAQMHEKHEEKHKQEHRHKQDDRG